MDKLKVYGKLSYGNELYANILDYPFKKDYRMISSDRHKVLVNYKAKQGYLVDNHWHNWIEFSYVVEGQALITCGSNQFILNSGAFILISIGDIHSTYLLKDSRIITFQVSQDYLANHYPFYFDKIDLCSVYQTPENEYIYDEIALAFFEIVKRFDKEDKIEQFGCNSYIDLFFYKIISSFQHRQTTVKKSKYHDILAKICFYINQNYQNNLTLNEIAQEFNVTPQYISKLFKQHMHNNFHHYLVNKRLNQAVYELTNTDYNIIAIGYNCGFPNKQSFITHFKNKYQITPLQFRKATRSHNWNHEKKKD